MCETLDLSIKQSGGSINKNKAEQPTFLVLSAQPSGGNLARAKHIKVHVEGERGSEVRN